MEDTDVLRKYYTISREKSHNQLDPRPSEIVRVLERHRNPNQRRPHDEHKTKLHLFHIHSSGQKRAITMSTCQRMRVGGRRERAVPCRTRRCNRSRERTRSMYRLRSRGRRRRKQKRSTARASNRPERARVFVRDRAVLDIDIRSARCAKDTKVMRVANFI